jgi:hypothetical protein
MKKAFKIILLIIGIYILIGIFHALSYSISYDPKVTSFPNDLSMFLMNVIFAPMMRIFQLIF